MEAFVLGLRDHGYVAGKNIAIEYRWADGKYDRLPALAAELVRLKVDVIVTQGTPAAFAAKRATPTIPIVMAIVGNPVESGIVASYARPGGNVTGSSFFWAELNAKRLELMKTLIPSLTRAGVLINPDNPAMVSLLREMEQRAQALKVELQPLKVRRLDELDAALPARPKQTEALTVVDDGLFVANAGRIAELAIKKSAAEHRLPGVLRSRWPARVRSGLPAHLAPGGGAGRQDLQGREAGGPAHPAGDTVRAGDQPQDREGPRAGDSAVGAGPGGSADRE